MSNTKEKIMAAGRELFEKKGFVATTTKEIAILAGISEVTLFRHFQTKRKLFEQTVHSCMYPYKLKEYLQSDVKYDLEIDLKQIAQNMTETYRQNLPMLRMVFKDKMNGSMAKMRLKEHENDVRGSLDDYFETMHNLGHMSADPKMARRFLMSNITGVFMKEVFSIDVFKNDKEYYAWMIEKVIAVLKG